MKETARRAIRTFFQSAAGYAVAHIAVTATGIAEGQTSLKVALVALITSALAAGIAAVMNLPRFEKKGEDDGK